MTASMQTLQLVLRWHDKARVPAAKEQEDERWERRRDVLCVPVLYFTKKTSVNQ